jgi:methylenetetrahydrofolate reductase (NADPH)
VAPELLEAVQRESTANDKGLRARLERAARTVAVLRGMGYAGAYIGGTHDAEHVQWIIRRAEQLTPGWEAIAAELNHGLSGGFYLPETSPAAVAGRTLDAWAPRVTPPVRDHPTAPGSWRAIGRGPAAPARRSTRRPLRVAAMDAMGRLFPVTRDTALRRGLRAVFARVDQSPGVAAAVERLELAVKQPLFGCQACGNCVLGHMEYVCPQTCPKQLRNGPCGGTHRGRCEVVDRPCIWVEVHDRARAAGRLDDLRGYIPPPDRSLQGSSSWVNYFLERDRRPCGEEPLVTRPRRPST